MKDIKIQEYFMPGSPIKIDTSIASKMVSLAKEAIGYDVNIMDSGGMIIASSDSARIGKFHEGASRILKGQQPSIEIDETSNWVGVKSGFNIALVCRNETVGVLGITGDPEKVRPYGQVLKLAMEAILEQEILKRNAIRHQTLNDRLHNALINGGLEESEILRYAKKLNIHDGVYRIPLLLRFEGNVNSENVFEILKKSPHSSQQDIMSHWKENDLLIFKCFDDMPLETVYKEYRNIIKVYLSEVFTWGKESGTSFKMYSGSFSRKLADYHLAVKRAVWLTTHRRQPLDMEFLYDYMLYYFSQFIPTSELQDMFQFFVSDVDNEFLQGMYETMDALKKSHYNLNTASKRLFVHKNTLFYRINKYREYYNIDPMGNVRDREFWEYLIGYYYRLAYKID
jgi:carbohydrate diacid regulator